MTNQNKKNKLEGLSKEQLIELIKLAEDRKEFLKYNKIFSYFPDTGPFRKELYPKHMELERAGKKHLIRGFIGGNGTGKSIWGCRETYFHCSGKYPSDWQGRRYKEPIKAWVVGRENKQMRAAIQDIMFGSYNEQGTGMFPKHDITDDNGHLTTRSMAGTAECIGTVQVRHYDEQGKFDGWSSIEFKTAAQGWQEFQGSTRQWIWIDEEPDDPKVYSECLARTRGPKGKEGSVLCTFTPLLGFSTIYLSFMPGGKPPENGISPHNKQKYTVVCSWEDVPHLTEEWKESQIAEWKISDPMSIKARTTGLASLGTGRIYPIDEDFVVVEPFAIPEHFKRAFGMDFGTSEYTAAVWVAQDPLTKTYYIYDEYERKNTIPELHALAIQNKGKWIPGLCDPAGTQKHIDSSWVDRYYELGLTLIPSQNSIKPGIAKILGLFETGRLKIFNTCSRLLEEIRMYRYSEKHPDDPAPNQKDHLCDSLKYVMFLIDYYSKSLQEHEDDEDEKHFGHDPDRDDRNSLTGY